MPKAIRITWTEFERGWGTRPDGASLHQTREHAVAFIERVWDQPVRENLDKGIVPDEYSRPDQTPQDAPEVEVSDEVLAKIIDGNGTAWETRT